MARLDKLMKSFEAFINNDTKAATQSYREFFIESAQEINKQLEEELDESFGGDPAEDLYDEVGVEDEESEEGFGGEEAADDFGGEDFGAEEAEEVELPSSDEWAEIQDAFDELESLFAELGGADEEADLGFDEPADDFGGEDEIVFGDEEDEELKEAFQMKAVKDPAMKSEVAGTDTHSIVNKKAKSVSGIKGTDGWSKDGSVTGSNTELDTSSAEKPKVEDQCNVMDSGKAAYKKHAAPAMKGETSGTIKQSIQKDLR